MWVIRNFVWTYQSLLKIALNMIIVIIEPKIKDIALIFGDLLKDMLFS